MPKPGTGRATSSRSLSARRAEPWPSFVTGEADQRRWTLCLRRAEELFADDDWPSSPLPSPNVRRSEAVYGAAGALVPFRRAGKNLQTVGQIASGETRRSEARRKRSGQAAGCVRRVLMLGGVAAEKALARWCARKLARVVEERYARQARNESLLREVNERIATLDRRAEAGWADGVPDRFEFHCECGASSECLGSVSMTLAEYEGVRTQADRFVVVPGHEEPQIERAVERSERYVIVDKLNAYEPFAGVDATRGDR